MDDLNPGAEGVVEELSLREQLMAAMEESSNVADTAPAGGEGTPPDIAPVSEGEQKGDRARDANGRFSKVEGAQEGAAQASQAAPAASEATVPGEAAPAAQDVPAAPQPPSSWSPTAKAAFAALPDAVREAITKRETEIEKGFAKYNDLRGLDEFSARAKSAGLTAAQLAGQYDSAERALRSNFPKAVHELAQQMGHHPFEVASAMIGVHPRALAGLLQNARQQPGGEQLAAQPQSAPAGALPPQMAHQIAHLDQAVRSLVGERVAAGHKAAQTVVDGFFNDPKFPYASNLENDILALVRQDPDRSDQRGALERAYQRAVWANPETRQLLIDQEYQTRSAAQAAPVVTPVARQTAAAAQARRAAGSITGSPANGAATTAEPAATLRDEIRRSMAAQRV